MRGVTRSVREWADGVLQAPASGSERTVVRLPGSPIGTLGLPKLGLETGYRCLERVLMAVSATARRNRTTTGCANEEFHAVLRPVRLELDLGVGGPWYAASHLGDRALRPRLEAR